MFPIISLLAFCISIVYSTKKNTELYSSNSVCVYISYQGPATEPIGNDVVDESNVKKNEHNKEVSTKATGEYIMYLSVKKKKTKVETPIYVAV